MAAVTDRRYRRFAEVSDILSLGAAPCTITAFDLGREKPAQSSENVEKHLFFSTARRGGGGQTGAR
jgi:hypothetical protein